MEKQAGYVNVKTRDGRVLLSLFFNPKDGIILENRLDSGTKREAGERRNGNGGAGGNGELMTYPQKRLLFRLLAQQGIERDKALEHLKKLFQVEDLKEVGKFEASKMIDGLLKGAKGGEGGGIPF